jgi:hypothetical protein
MRILLCLLALSAAALGQATPKPGSGKTAAKPPAAATPAPKPGATPAPPPGSGPTGYVINGDFQKSSPADNLWDGVNAAGGLAGEVRQAFALTDKGPPGGVNLPISVNFVDMNGDGVGDIVSADPAGTMRVYFNSGSKTEPVFTHAETVPLFLSRPAKDEIFDYWWGHGMAKISMYDWNKSGNVDLLFGNYSGEMVFIPNAGTAGAPSFPQPAVYARATIPTSKKNQLWANLLAPCVHDWNKDGKPDILVGEGSYSANSIHLLLNESSSSGGKFSEDSRYFLCYGDGREHLVPTVADWNNDGEMDVLVGDRTGGIAVHVRQPGWKPGDEVKLTQFIDFGGKDRLNIAITPTAADMNGDGLFDILLGRADGRIQMSLNKGAPGQPKFELPVDVKGKDIWGKNILNPVGFTSDNGNQRGNIYGYVSVTDQPSPNGGKVLKMGYWPSPNKIIKLVHPTVTGQNTKHFWRNDRGIWYVLDASRGAEFKQTNAFTLRQNLQGLKVGQNYVLNFKARGKRMVDGLATIALFGHKEVAPPKFTKKASGRGATATRNEKTEEVFIEENLNQTNTWQVVSKPFTVAFKDKDVKTLTEPTFAVLEFKAFLSQYDGELEVCDVSITPGK